MCVGFGECVGGTSREQCLPHAERSKQTGLENTGQRFVFDLLGDQTEQRIVGVAIVVSLSGRE